MNDEMNRISGPNRIRNDFQREKTVNNDLVETKSAESDRFRDFGALELKQSEEKAKVSHRNENR